MESSPSRIRYSEDGKTREGRLLSFSEMSRIVDETHIRVPHSEYTTSINVAAFLAWKHFRERSGVVLPSLPSQLEGCDFNWTLDNRDTLTSQKQAVGDLVDATTDPQRFANRNNTSTSTSTNNNNTSTSNNEDWQFPFAMLGSVYSRISFPLSVMGEAYEMPQVSGASTSSRLDFSPYFARTINSNALDAASIIRYCTHFGITHFAALYLRDEYGLDFISHLQTEANKHGIYLLGFGHLDEAPTGDMDTLQNTLEQVKQSGMRYVLSLLFEWEDAFLAAYDMGIMGNADYVWFGYDLGMPTKKFRRDNPSDLKLAKVLDGLGVINIQFPEKEKLLAAYSEFTRDEQLQREFINTFPKTDQSFWQEQDVFAPVYGDYPYLYTSYDAVLTLGLAACRTPGLFTSGDLYDTMVNMQFEGISGNVSFNNQTGTRSYQDFHYSLNNWFWSDEGSNRSIIQLERRQSAMLSADAVVTLAEFRYNGNTTIPPPFLKPAPHDYNLMPVGVQIFGWVLGGAMMAFSLMLAGWVCWNRNKYAVRVSQPVFLVKICMGTLIASAAIIPLGMQGKESSHQLDIACMSVVWLVAIGFVPCFSAILSRTWRLNKLMASGRGYRRSQVYARDVAWPFFVLITINVALLIGWTVAAPLKYVRIETENVDSFGRHVESYGRCHSSNFNLQLAFVIPLLLTDFSGVAVAVYQSYKARHFAHELQESSYLAMSMLSFAETLFLGVPILFAASSDPTATFLVVSVLICIACLTILLPVFVPKYLHRKEANSEGRGATNLMTSTEHQRPQLFSQITWGKMRFWQNETEEAERRLTEHRIATLSKMTNTSNPATA